MIPKYRGAFLLVCLALLRNRRMLVQKSTTTGIALLEYKMEARQGCLKGTNRMLLDASSDLLFMSAPFP